MLSSLLVAACAFHVHKHTPHTTKEASFGFVGEGGAVLKLVSGPLNSSSYPLCSGMWFSSSDPVCVYGNAVVIEESTASPLFQVGGPVESHGRIAYMDGITETQILRPSKDGEPCLNFMHFPRNCMQTPHYHTEARVIIVAKGSARYTNSKGTRLLREGDVLEVHPYDDHSFETQSEECTLITWHPASEGPTDEDNPMTKATFVR